MCRENVSLEYSVLLLGGHGIEVEPIALNPDNAGMLCFCCCLHHLVSCQSRIWSNVDVNLCV